MKFLIGFLGLSVLISPASAGQNSAPRPEVVNAFRGAFMQIVKDRGYPACPEKLVEDAINDSSRYVFGIKYACPKPKPGILELWKANSSYIPLWSIADYELNEQSGGQIVVIYKKTFYRGVVDPCFLYKPYIETARDKQAECSGRAHITDEEINQALQSIDRSFANSIKLKQRASQNLNVHF